eukprot:146394_1
MMHCCLFSALRFTLSSLAQMAFCTSKRLIPVARTCCNVANSNNHVVITEAHYQHVFDAVGRGIAHLKLVRPQMDPKAARFQMYQGCAHAFHGLGYLQYRKGHSIPGGIKDAIRAAFPDSE